MRHKRFALTLVELCVVLAIILVMLGILIPATQKVREAARETVCKNNLRQMGLAFRSYVEFANITEPESADQIGGWAIDILPLLEQQNLERSLSPGLLIADLSAEEFRRPQIMGCPTQLGIRPVFDDRIESAHYVLRGGSITDAPLSLDQPWVASPNLARAEVIQNDGPHYGGYYRTGSNNEVFFSSEF